MKFPVFDFHCDTSLVLARREMEGKPASLRRNGGHIDLERAKGLDGYAQCFGCFTTPHMGDREGVSPTTVLEKEIDMVHREVSRNADLISLCYTPAEIRANYAAGKMSAILTLEGTAGFGFDPELLPQLYAVGFRVSSLGWNEKNPLTGSNVTGGGLTDRGREFVRMAQSLGILVDVSHISDEGFWDIMEMTQAPVIATHSNARAVWSHPRNLTDDMFREICRVGGVAGYNTCAEFTGENPDLDTICDHILHFLELDPDGTHVALGGDLDGVEKTPAGFDGVQSYPAVAKRLLERGAGEQTVQNVFWNNALGVMERAVCNNPQ